MLALRFAFLIAGTASLAANAQTDRDLAQLLTNPIPAVASMEIQYNQDRGSSGDPRKDYINFLPVVPFSLNGDWNLISKTYTAVTRQEIGGETHSGIQYIVPAFFFSPAKPTQGGFLWGVGPVFQLPVADEDLGYRKLGAGPTGFIARHDGPWSYGVLADHLVSIAGSKDRPSFSATYFGPWVSYTTDAAWVYTANVESVYDWKGKQWAAPLQLLAAKLVRANDQRMEIGAGVRYWMDNGQYDVGFRLFVNLVFGK